MEVIADMVVTVNTVGSEKIILTFINPKRANFTKKPLK
jgi:hypothetical protein